MMSYLMMKRPIPGGMKLKRKDERSRNASMNDKYARVAMFFLFFFFSFRYSLAFLIATGKIPSANSASNFYDAEESYSRKVP